MKNQQRENFYEIINRLPLMQFLNIDLDKMDRKLFEEFVDDCIVRIGCHVDRLHSSKFDLEAEDGISLDMKNQLSAFKSSTTFKTRSFTKLLKENYEVRGKKFNRIGYQTSLNNLSNSDIIKLIHRMSDFYYMGAECSVHVQQLWESKNKLLIYSESVEAHKQLTELVETIRADKVFFNEALKIKSIENKIYNGFVLILINLNDLDVRSFSIEKNLICCLECKKYSITDTKNRTEFCSEECYKLNNRKNNPSI